MGQGAAGFDNPEGNLRRFAVGAGGPLLSIEYNLSGWLKPEQPLSSPGCRARRSIIGTARIVGASRRHTYIEWTVRGMDSAHDADDSLTFSRWTTLTMLHLLHTAYDASLSPWDVVSLMILDSVGPLQPGELAELSGFATGQLTKIVDRLVSAKFVRRAKHPTDRRRQIIVIRVAGKHAVTRWLADLEGMHPDRKKPQRPTTLPATGAVDERWQTFLQSLPAEHS